MNTIYWRLSMAGLLILLNCERAFAFIATEYQSGNPFTEILVFLLIIGLVLSPLVSLSIVGFRLYKNRRLFKVFNWLTVMAAILLLVAGIAVLNLYVLGFGLMYIFVALFTSRRYKELGSEE